MKNRLTFYKQVLFTLFFCAAQYPAILHALTPASIDYTVSIVSDKLGNATLGNLQTSLSETETGYAVYSKTVAQGLAAILIGSNFYESCEFSVNDGRAFSNRYEGGKKDSEDYSVAFDWEKRKITFKEDNKLVDMPNGYIVNNCNFAFAAALSKGENLSNETFYVVDGKKKRVRGYSTKFIGNETVLTDFGEVQALKIVMEREFKPERKFIFWLAIDYSYLPIKMEESRSSRVVTMLANQIEIE